MRIAYSGQALEDLRRIEQRYAERAGVDIAEILLRRILGTLERLIARNPRIGRLRPEFVSGIRSFPVLPYMVFYSIGARRVYVQRILHGHRDIRPPLTSLLVAV